MEEEEEEALLQGRDLSEARGKKKISEAERRFYIIFIYIMKDFGPGESAVVKRVVVQGP